MGKPLSQCNSGGKRIGLPECAGGIPASKTSQQCMKRSESPCVDALGTPDLVAAIAGSMMFRTFARIYENEFGVPLYLESALQPGKLNNARSESEFCVELNRGNGDCTGCPFNILPRPQTLPPWTWSAPCRLGQQVTLVPLMVNGKVVAWMITGHYFVGGEAAGSRGLSDESMRRIAADGRRREFLTQAYGEIKNIPQARHGLMVRFLVTCGALIGANLNRFLIGNVWDHAERSESEIGDRGGAAFSDSYHGAGRDPITGLAIGNEEIATRTRIEKARRRFLRTQGHNADIGLAAKEAGWVDHGDFERAFLECIGESPSEHWKKITGLWSDFSSILADSLHQPVGS
jgi:AraC-like DNA-binding protein